MSRSCDSAHLSTLWHMSECHNVRRCSGDATLRGNYSLCVVLSVPVLSRIMVRLTRWCGYHFSQISQGDQSY